MSIQEAKCVALFTSEVEYMSLALASC